MCPSIEETPANGATNGHSNGDDATLIEARPNPVPHHKSSPYQPVGDFLSNISRFKIIESTLREGEQFAKCVPLCPRLCSRAKPLQCLL
jgi:homocitrate synthase